MAHVTDSVLALLLLAPALALTVGDSCGFVDGRPGQCTPLPYCEELFSLLQSNPTRETFELLSASNCGYQGKVPVVCCPQPRRQANQFSPSATPSAPISERPADVSIHPRIRLLPSSSCGVESSDRIIGGNKTSVFEFPWMALLGYTTAGNKFGGFRCGGALISRKYVLTAAHCISTDPRGLRLTTVRLGEHDLRTTVDCDGDIPGLSVCAPPPQNFDVDYAIGHPLFTKDKLQNDIGLIRIKGEATFTDAVSPICLPVGEEQLRNLEKTKLFVAGWGVTETGAISQELLKVIVPEVSTQRCAGVYRKNNVAISLKQICAGGSGGRDSCAGDSGGPLMSYAAEGGSVRWVQYGIVSFGPKQCATEGYPGVYTRVAYYMDWILDNMRP